MPLSPAPNPNPTARPRARLEQVTLCAISSSNIAATIRALEASLAQIEFAQALLFTDADPALIKARASGEIRVVPIDPLNSSQAYSRFVLEHLADHIATSHCLIVQWDGHVIDASRWKPDFLQFDYIGASWPQFEDAHVVGNGGFSLRSRRLLEACRETGFSGHHPEDVAICRTNRDWLEKRGLRFAPVELADRFSAERSGDPEASFGFHGVFLMPQVIGVDGFWDIYRSLDERSSLRHDFLAILASLRRGKNPIWRALVLTGDYLRDLSRAGG